MTTRIVKMTFRPDAVRRFEELIAAWAPRIRAFPGCQHLELLRDAHDPCTFFTYSHWAGPADLEAYRTSAVFAEVWPVVKTLFAEPAQAWTVHRTEVPPAGT